VQRERHWLVSPEDRKYVPTSIEASVVRPGTEEKPGTAAVRQPTNQPTRAPEPSPTTATPAAPTRSAEIGTIAINSNPDGAELFVDSRYAGNAPASIKLTLGTHSIQVVMKGYKDWARDISITAGSDLKVNAALERQ